MFVWLRRNEFAGRIPLRRNAPQRLHEVTLPVASVTVSQQCPNRAMHASARTGRAYSSSR